MHSYSAFKPQPKCLLPPKTSALAIFCSPCHTDSLFFSPVLCGQRSWPVLTLSMDPSVLCLLLGFSQCEHWQRLEERRRVTRGFLISPAPSLGASWLASIPKLHGLAVSLNWKPQHLLAVLFFPPNSCFYSRNFYLSPLYCMKPGSIMTSNISHYLVSLHLLTFW